jgi:hypothetical protein
MRVSQVHSFLFPSLGFVLYLAIGLLFSSSVLRKRDLLLLLPFFPVHCSFAPRRRGHAACPLNTAAATAICRTHTGMECVVFDVYTITQYVCRYIYYQSSATINRASVIINHDHHPGFAPLHLSITTVSITTVHLIIYKRARSFTENSSVTVSSIEL